MIIRSNSVIKTILKHKSKFMIFFNVEILMERTKERTEYERKRWEGNRKERWKEKRRQTKYKILYLLIELIVFLFGKTKILD